MLTRTAYLRAWVPFSVFAGILALTSAPAAWALTGTDGTYTYIDSEEAAGATVPVFNYTQLVNPTVMPLTDESTQVVNLGFNFTFYGTVYTQVTVSSNGIIYFGAPVSDFGGQLAEVGTPTLPPNNAIFLHWADLDPGAGGRVSFLSCGLAPNRYCCIEFDGVDHWTAPGLPCFVQCWLFENGSEILWQVQTATADDSGAADAFGMQIQNAGGTLRLIYTGSFWTGTGTLIPALFPSAAVRFTTNPASPSPSIPPGRIADLAAANPTDGTADLTWTAVGADAMVGTATSYDVRWATAAILTEADFAAANQATGEPAPQASGSAEAFTVTGLPELTTIFFAVVAIDNNGSAGCASNSPSITTLDDTINPSQVTDLTITGMTSTTMSIRWTAPGDDGIVGTALSYDVRVSTAGLITDANFAAATPVAGEPTPSPFGSVETMTIFGLTPFTRYWVALQAVDNGGNRSPTSNSPNDTTGEPQWEAPATGSDTGGGISNTAAYSVDPCMDVNPVTFRPGVAWTDQDPTNLDLEIFMAQSSGAAFVGLGTPASNTGGGLSINATASQFPDIVYDSAGRAVVAWQDVDGTNGDNDIYVRRFDGAAWQELAGSATGGGVSQNGSPSTRPSVDIHTPQVPPQPATDDQPGVAWVDYSLGDFEIFFREFDTSVLPAPGAWAQRAGSGQGQGVSNNGGASLQPSLAYDSLGRPVIAWADDSSGNWEVYLRRYNPALVPPAWEELAGSATSGGISSTPTQVSQNPSLAIGFGDNPFVVWQENLPDGNVEIYGRRFDGAAWVDFGPGSAANGGISGTPGRSITPELCEHPGFFDVFMCVWTDFSFAPGSSEVYGKWFDNGQWRELGTSSAHFGGISNTAGQSLSPCCGIANILAPGIPVAYVSWQEFSGGNYEVFVRSLALFGSVADSNMEFVAGGGTGGRGQYRVFDNGTAAYAALELRTVPFSVAYNTNVGTTHPACGDVDGDGLDEVIVGQGSFPGGDGGWVSVLRDHSGLDPALPANQLAMIRFPWTAYNNANGAVFPAAGDIDGDGRDELVLGMGTFPGGGFAALFDDQVANFAPRGWMRVNYAAYTSANGEIHPACGDVDGDRVEEIMLGLGPGGNGYVQVRNNLARGLGHLGWLRYPNAGYDSANGTTWPACGNLTGGPGTEIVVGPGRGGAGALFIYGDRAAAFARVGGLRLPWSAYDGAVGEVRPAVGNLDPDLTLEVVGGLGPYPGVNTGGWLYVFNNVTTVAGAPGVWVRYTNSNAAYNSTNGETFPATGQIR